MRTLSIMLLAIAAVALWGCGGGASSSQPFTIQSGNWSISAVSTAAPGNNFLGGGSLSQSGNSVSGVLHIFGSGCFDGSTDIPVSGSVSGQKITLTSPAVIDQVVTVNVTGSSSTALSGTYTITITGPNCIGGSNDQGTVSATLVPSISGTWHGSFTSIVTPSTSINVTANVTQSATPDAHGVFPITGTLTVSGSPCFTAGDIVSTPIQSIITGAAVVLSITTNDQPTAGFSTLGGTLDVPSTANSLTGTYVVRSGNCALDELPGHMTRP